MAHTERPLTTDPTFWGLLVTQFLGAFNDNVFKFLVMFLCAGQAKRNPQDDWQFIATIAFAAPFVLFSGLCGFLGDRYSKRQIIVTCKLLEIGVMGAGLWVLWATHPSQLQLGLLIGVLFLMGAHSTLFGPAKYGILPELYPKHRLPSINGWFLMTTFVAIIGGGAAAGFLKDELPSLVSVQCVCIVIAMLGTVASLPIRRTPIAHPGLPFNRSAFFIDPEARAALRQQPKLRTALFYTSIFWFVGGVFLQAVVSMGSLQYDLSDTNNGLLAATTSVGIACGSVLAGILSRSRFRAGLVRWSGLGMVICMGWLAIPGEKFVVAQSIDHPSPQVNASAAETTQVTASFPSISLRRPMVSLLGAGMLLTGAGLFAGLFAVPLQVYMQAMSPPGLKGRMIGAMNLLNWIGIVLSGVFYGVFGKLFVALEIGPNAIFGAVSVVVLLAILMFKMQDESLEATPVADS